MDPGVICTDDVWNPQSQNEDYEEDSILKENEEIILECDFDGLPDSNPLYRMIERKNWDGAREMLNHTTELENDKYGCYACQHNLNAEVPDGRRLSKAWITRKNPDGTTKWRITVLHAVVLFRAPSDILALVLNSHPLAASASDDRGNLPVHLAFNTGMPEDMINILLEAYPQAMDTQNRSGLTPLDCLVRKNKTSNQSALVGYLISSKTRHDRELESERTLFAERLNKVEEVVRAEQDMVIAKKVNASMEMARQQVAEAEERLREELRLSLLEEAREATGKDIADAARAMDVRIDSTNEVRTAAESSAAKEKSKTRGSKSIGGNTETSNTEKVASSMVQTPKKKSKGKLLSKLFSQRAEGDKFDSISNAGKSVRAAQALKATYTSNMKVTVGVEEAGSNGKPAAETHTSKASERGQIKEVTKNTPAQDTTLNNASKGVDQEGAKKVQENGVDLDEANKTDKKGTGKDDANKTDQKVTDKDEANKIDETGVDQDDAENAAKASGDGDVKPTLEERGILQDDWNQYAMNTSLYKWLRGQEANADETREANAKQIKAEGTEGTEEGVQEPTDEFKNTTRGGVETYSKEATKNANNEPTTAVETDSKEAAKKEDEEGAKTDQEEGDKEPTNGDPKEGDKKGKQGGNEDDAKSVQSSRSARSPSSLPSKKSRFKLSKLKSSKKKPSEAKKQSIDEGELAAKTEAKAAKSADANADANADAALDRVKSIAEQKEEGSGSPEAEKGGKEGAGMTPPPAQPTKERDGSTTMPLVISFFDGESPNTQASTPKAGSSMKNASATARDAQVVAPNSAGEAPGITEDDTLEHRSVASSYAGGSRSTYFGEDYVDRWLEDKQAMVSGWFSS